MEMSRRETRRDGYLSGWDTIECKGCRTLEPNVSPANHHCLRQRSRAEAVTEQQQGENNRRAVRSSAHTFAMCLGVYALIISENVLSGSLFPTTAADTS